ncbi:glycoside hydrolase family 3 N-terminal domain-containing protein [Pseudomonas sp. BNK-43-a]|uniref:glycoside hydrolase family 3 N-terminal domain-containing protein n=1 Tax=unclassified Pseudomonas TaxID=196821 RepID=UPI0039BF0D33
MTASPESTLNPSRLIESLLGRMTFAQKLAQLQIAFKPKFEDAAELARSGVGALFWPRDAERTNELQRIAREQSPHGIPLLIGLDVIHGQYTIFPTPLAQASSFDPEVAQLDARVSAKEARSGGVNWTFSPMVDVSRDPRWGRVVEGFGEDPYLNAVMGAAKVRGYQGDQLASHTNLLACAKHYVGYGQPEGGRDYNTADMSEQRLHNVYLEPFKALAEAGVGSVMAAFNTVAGRPCHANYNLLTQILKQQWGYRGLVVGDADGVPNLIAHGIVEDLSQGLAEAFAAGLDMDMGGYVIDPYGGTGLTEADIAPERLNDAVRRVLEAKFALGLFENPFVDTPAAIKSSTDETRAAARQAARRSIVLLKNDHTLPVRPAVRRLLLVGPYAQSTDHLGAWVQSFASPAGNLADALQAQLDNVDLTVLPGAVFEGSDPQLQRQACEAALKNDMIIIAVGEPSHMSGEASCRSQLNLPGDQEALISAIASTGVPFAVVLSTGRPLVLSAWAHLAPAIVQTWHLGTEAPAAIADVLLGHYNPGGKLPISFPRSVGQVPIYYAHENTGRPATASAEAAAFSKPQDIGLQGPNNTDDYFTSKYLDLPLGPLFSFGHGLSYTTFALTDLSVTPSHLSMEQLKQGESFQVQVKITNTGGVEGDDVVQVYIRDCVASVAQPIRRLRAFQRVTIKPGQSKALTFTFGCEDLGFWSDLPTAGYRIEPGEFEAHIGSSLDSTRKLSMKVSR